jgi:hypothetical protein
LPTIPTRVRGRSVLGSSIVLAAFDTIGANAPVGTVEKEGGALVKRFVTVVTVALVGAAVVTHWKRV